MFIASLSRAQSVAGSCAAGTLPGPLQARGADARYATAGVPAALALCGAVSLTRLTAWVLRYISYMDLYIII